MRVKVRYRSGREDVFEKVDKFAQAPGAIHLINVNAQAIAILPLDGIESLYVPAHETDIVLN